MGEVAQAAVSARFAVQRPAEPGVQGQRRFGGPSLIDSNSPALAAPGVPAKSETLWGGQEGASPTRVRGSWNRRAAGI